MVCAAYGHARTSAGGRGRKSAYVSLVGLACFLIHYLGMKPLRAGAAFVVRPVRAAAEVRLVVRISGASTSLGILKSDTVRRGLVEG